MIASYITISYEFILAIGQIRARLGVKNPDNKAGRFHSETSFVGRTTSSRSTKLSLLHGDTGVMVCFSLCVRNPDDKAGRFHSKTSFTTRYEKEMSPFFPVYFPRIEISTRWGSIRMAL